MLGRKAVKNMFSHFSHYSHLSYFTVKETLNAKPIGSKILVQGWVQAIRKHKDLYFVDLVDRTCFKSLQIIIHSNLNNCPSYGSSIKVEGSLLKSSHKGQEVELLADKLSTYGYCSSDYPFEYRTKYTPEYVRQFPHLRPRTRKISSILRVRNNASFAFHQFFQNEQFCFVHTPIITQNDCEGAGEVFSVEVKNLKQSSPGHHGSSDTSDSDSEVDKKTELEKISSLNNKVDPTEFFGAPTYLTVSGQLHLEAMACAITRAYNFGPVFRAENSSSRQHASEFHMIEAEMAFIDTVEELTEFVEKCIKFVAKSVLDNCYSEVEFLNENANHQEYLKKLITDPFIVMSYSEALKVLDTNKDKLKVPIRWGDDLAANHKNFLVKHCNNHPVFVTMFPSSLKPFYMKTDVNQTEAYCFDLFAPFGGEICGGSIRESSEEILKKKAILENSSLSWYLDLRRYGAVPHGGFGIGFDRLLQSFLGISNIRDIIPFPRRKHDCKC